MYLRRNLTWHILKRLLECVIKFQQQLYEFNYTHTHTHGKIESIVTQLDEIFTLPPHFQSLRTWVILAHIIIIKSCEVHWFKPKDSSFRIYIQEELYTYNIGRLVLVKLLTLHAGTHTVRLLTRHKIYFLVLFHNLLLCVFNETYNMRSVWPRITRQREFVVLFRILLYVCDSL